MIPQNYNRSTNLSTYNNLNMKQILSKLADSKAYFIQLIMVRIFLLSSIKRQNYLIEKERLYVFRITKILLKNMKMKVI